MTGIETRPVTAQVARVPGVVHDAVDVLFRKIALEEHLDNENIEAQSHPVTVMNETDVHAEALRWWFRKAGPGI